MNTSEHRLGVSEANRVRRSLKLKPCERDKVDAAVADIDEVLGMCPMLAVTNTAINSVAMGGATMFTLVSASFSVSVFKSFIPHQVRISTFVIIIATFVTIADYSLQATLPGVFSAIDTRGNVVKVNDGIGMRLLNGTVITMKRDRLPSIDQSGQGEVHVR